MQIIVNKFGAATCLYDEAIDLSSLGKLSITRASFVEPTCFGAWFADMSPVADVKLGPFLLRSEALAAEREWLERELLPRASMSSPAGS